MIPEILKKGDTSEKNGEGRIKQPANQVRMRNSQVRRSRKLIPLLYPFRQPAAIFFQQEGSHAEALAENAMRFLIARGA